MSQFSAFTDFERGVHDRIAARYHAAFTPVTEKAHAPLLEAAGVTSGDRVLDVATGPGALAAKAAARGAAVTGVDLSPRMVELAAELFPAVQFQIANAEELPFASDSFDVILCNFGIGHFPRAEQAFAEFARVLSPGGRIAVSWWEGPSRMRLNGVFFDAIQEEAIRIPDALPPGPGAYRFSEDAAVIEVFAQAGLGAPAIKTWTGLHHLPDFDALWSLAQNSFARLGTIIASLDEIERERFRAAVATRAATYGGGPLAMPFAFRVASIG